jgi:hypothetical protein
VTFAVSCALRWIIINPLKLKDHPLSTARYCLPSIFAAILYDYRWSRGGDSWPICEESKKLNLTLMSGLQHRLWACIAHLVSSVSHWLHGRRGYSTLWGVCKHSEVRLVITEWLPLGFAVPDTLSWSTGVTPLQCPFRSTAFKKVDTGAGISCFMFFVYHFIASCLLVPRKQCYPLSLTLDVALLLCSSLAQTPSS